MRVDVEELVVGTNYGFEFGEGGQLGFCGSSSSNGSSLSLGSLCVVGLMDL